MKKCIILIIMMFIATAATVDAETDFGENSSLLVKRLTEQYERFNVEYPQRYQSLGERVKFMEYASKMVYGLDSVFYENLIPFLLIEAPIDNPVVRNILDSIILIIQPFYVFAIIITALYLILASGSPSGRKNAKSSLVRLIVGIGLIMLSIPIIRLLSEISKNLTSLILDLFDPDPRIFSEMTDFFFNHFMAISLFKPILGLPFLTLAVLMPLSVLCILSLRYFMVMIMTLFFPFAVLLFSFKPTKSIGSRILNQILIWVFLPVMEALTLGVVYIAIHISPIPEMRIFMLFAGSLLLIMTPLIMFGAITFILSLGIFSIIVGKPLALLTAYVDRAITKNE